MELICEKYNQKMDSTNADCRHPREYCKYRSSCVINFSFCTPLNAHSDDKTSMEKLNFDKGKGLLPAVVQDFKTGEVLMLAYINEEAWQKTLETNKAHFWSRSRKKLWLKGESSKHYQIIKDILIDCDEDAVIFKVEQLGAAACHKGYRSCFFRRVDGKIFKVKDEPVFNPKEVYQG